MKISKERRQLCDDVTNSYKVEARKRREKAIEHQMDMIFGYALLLVMTITFIVSLVDVWRAL